MSDWHKGFLFGAGSTALMWMAFNVINLLVGS